MLARLFCGLRARRPYPLRRLSPEHRSPVRGASDSVELFKLANRDCALEDVGTGGAIPGAMLGLTVGLARPIPQAAARDRSTPDRRDETMSDVTGKREKSRLREGIRAARRAIEPDLRDAWNGQIREALLKTEPWRRARNVLAYCSMPEEVATWNILHFALQETKRLALPRCIPGESRFEAHWITDPRRDLIPGVLPGLMEPRENAPACRAAEPFDLIIVPGIAFDRRGYRIGFGAGMYDRFLVSHLDSRRLALAYSLQIVDHVPADPHDLPVHAILTEEGMIEAAAR